MCGVPLIEYKNLRSTMVYRKSKWARYSLKINIPDYQCVFRLHLKCIDVKCLSNGKFNVQLKSSSVYGVLEIFKDEP